MENWNYIPEYNLNPCVWIVILIPKHKQRPRSNSRVERVSNTGVTLFRPRSHASLARSSTQRQSDQWEVRSADSISMSATATLWHDLQGVAHTYMTMRVYTSRYLCHIPNTYILHVSDFNLCMDGWQSELSVWWMSVLVWIVWAIRVKRQVISIAGSPGHGSWTFRFNQILGIPWQAEPLSVSQEIFFVRLVCRVMRTAKFMHKASRKTANMKGIVPCNHYSRHTMEDMHVGFHFGVGKTNWQHLHSITQTH